ncbi:hypothetical protein HD554DRAFT_2124723 [Boletus coccyginus]|nr:hypothetical protein HD554DRAFT_2124723 [Boletus coccyginus]
MDAQVDCSMSYWGNSGTCECEEFHWPDDGKPVCYECDHGISKHSTASSMISLVPAQRSNPPPLPPSLNLPPPFLLESTLNSRVQAIFNDLLKQELLKVKSLTMTQMAARARAEAMAMFRSRKQKDITQALTNASTQGSDRSHLPSGLSTQASLNTSMVFHVGSIAMVAPFGKTFASEVQVMKNQGCFISATSPKGGIAQVCKWFLPVFTYLSKAPHRKQPSWSSSRLLRQLEWLVLIYSSNSFSIVEIAEPNGSTLFKNKGHGKVGIADSTLWFVTRKSIPDETYDLWNKEPLIIGSDFEFELDSIQNDSQDSSPVVEDIISISTDSTSDLDVKLSSSMLDLTMSTVSKDKGKSILKKHEDPITPPCKSAPQVLSAPTIISVSENDVILWGHHFPDSPNAPTAVNLWHPASEYPFMQFREFNSFI